MKALTVRQPWASLIVHGVKHIETRSKATKIRGRIGIIAGMKLPPYGLQVGRYTITDAPGYWVASDIPLDMNERTTNTLLPFGALIGTVELYDCVPIVASKSTGGSPKPEQMINYGAQLRTVRRLCPPGPGFGTQGYAVEINDDQLPYGDFTPGRWAWLLRDPQPLAEPIGMRGAQHWQEVDV